jgi:hypothetical protein
MPAEKDPKGERGGSTGHSKQQGEGPQAEKGDVRRQTPHSGPTRPGGSGRGRPGSESNPD